MLSTKKRNHQEFKISSRLEDMMKPQEPQPNPAQPEEEKKDDAVHVASNSTSRVNGAWGPFGFRRDATNYKMTQPSSNPNQTPFTQTTSQSFVKKMKLNDGTIVGSQEANQILDEMDDDDVSEDAME